MDAFSRDFRFAWRGLRRRPVFSLTVVSIDLFDPKTLVAVSLLLVMVSLLAMFLPARRAASIDPVKALRFE